MKKSLQIFFFFFLVTQICFAQWFWQNPLPQGNNLNDVDFIDENNGIAVGEYGIILRTTDGGTKTAHIENLAELPHGGHSIVSWSLNAEPVRQREETRAATIRQRLRAAQQCAEWGYWLSFHFDPMIHYPDWRKDYGEVLARLFDAVDPGRIVWISLGAFRFMP